MFNEKGHSIIDNKVGYLADELAIKNLLNCLRELPYGTFTDTERDFIAKALAQHALLTAALVLDKTKDPQDKPLVYERRPKNPNIVTEGSHNWCDIFQ